MKTLLLLAALKFIVLAPGHFHAALALNRSYPDVDKEVRVFAPEGPDVLSHEKLVEGFNTRTNNPTAWREVVYTGADYLEQFKAYAKTVKPSDCIVILAGRNNVKGDYCLAAVRAGYNVLCDKPMAITPKEEMKVLQAAILADRKGLLFSDIMTERNEITTILQRELVNTKALYGEQEAGTPEAPAITKESVHHFCKFVDGKPLRRPAWYYDTQQQGEAIVDVTTHLVDLIQWEAFPNAVLRNTDVKVVSAKVWPTMITAADYATSTGETRWPSYLKGAVDANNVLPCLANGTFTYLIKGVYARVSVIWNFTPPRGTGDTHDSVMRGTKAEVAIHQNAETNYKPVLFVTARGDADETAKALTAALIPIERAHPGTHAVAVKPGVWRIGYPSAYDIGHEAHFSQVVNEYLKWKKAGVMPEERRQNMLVKYHTLVEAWKKAR